METRQTRPLARKQTPWKEEAIRFLLLACALASVLTTLGIVVVLAKESAVFLAHVPLWEFLFGFSWNPQIEPQSFGILPLVNGTVLVALGACLIAVPLGVGGGLFLSDYARQGLRAWLKPILEVLAGIPSVVYGYFALTTVTPWLRRLIPTTEVFNAASASIVVGIMVLPLVASLSDDAFRAVPRSLREAGYAMGATRLEVSTQIVLPGALSGVMASVILAFSRAVGETMAVALAAGATPRMTLNPLVSIQTMTAYIVKVSLGDTPSGSIEYQTIFAVGGVLFLMTFAMNILAQKILKRFRLVYE